MATVLIAPDKFKGSLTAKQVCSSIEEGLLLIDPRLTIISRPLADGGEGTTELLTEYSRGRLVTITVLNPLFHPIEAQYGISSDGKIAFMEMAKASGLLLLDPVDRNPMQTSTFGIGQMIKHAMESGVKHIILGIGGSATNDAGIGMADALGFSFVSSSGERLKPIGENLINIEKIDQQLVHPLVAETKFTVLCDVDNPLYGKNGAAHVFAPQKGASPSDVLHLNAGLQNFERVVGSSYEKEIGFRGAGAAGGMGAGTKIFLKASITSGFNFISTFIKLDNEVIKADLVITGEGKIDAQTWHGKAVEGVAELASFHNKPCVAFAGKSDYSMKGAKQIPPGFELAKIITLTDEKTSEKEAIANAFDILKDRVVTHLKSMIQGL